MDSYREGVREVIERENREREKREKEREATSSEGRRRRESERASNHSFLFLVFSLFFCFTLFVFTRRARQRCFAFSLFTERTLRTRSLWLQSVRVRRAKSKAPPWRLEREHCIALSLFRPPRWNFPKRSQACLPKNPPRAPSRTLLGALSSSSEHRKHRPLRSLSRKNVSPCRHEASEGGASQGKTEAACEASKGRRRRQGREGGEFLLPLFRFSPWLRQRALLPLQTLRRSLATGQGRRNVLERGCESQRAFFAAMGFSFARSLNCFSFFFLILILRQLTPPSPSPLSPPPPVFIDAQERELHLSPKRRTKENARMALFA